MRWRAACEESMGSAFLGNWICGSQKPLCWSTMALSFGVFLVRVRDCDLSITQILSSHCLNSSIRSVKGVIADETETSRVASIRISHYLRIRSNATKSAESIIQDLLIHIRVKIANEKVSTNIQALLILRRLVNTNRLAMNFNHVENLNRIVSIFLATELNESIP